MRLRELTVDLVAGYAPVDSASLIGNWFNVSFPLRAQDYIGAVDFNLTVGVDLNSIFFAAGSFGGDFFHKQCGDNHFIIGFSTSSIIMNGRGLPPLNQTKALTSFGAYCSDGTVIFIEGDWGRFDQVTAAKNCSGRAYISHLNARAAWQAPWGYVIAGFDAICRRGQNGS